MDKFWAFAENPLTFEPPGSLNTPPVYLSLAKHKSSILRCISPTPKSIPAQIYKPVLGSSLQISCDMIIASSESQPGKMNDLLHPLQAPTSYVDSCLKHCTQDAILRCHPIGKNSQPRYDDPFKVLNRSDKSFNFLLNGNQLVNISRLQTAFAEHSSSDCLNKTTKRRPKSLVPLHIYRYSKRSPWVRFPQRFVT